MWPCVVGMLGCFRPKQVQGFKPLAGVDPCLGISVRDFW